jgi:hypothetical protein
MVSLITQHGLWLLDDIAGLLWGFVRFAHTGSRKWHIFFAAMDMNFGGPVRETQNNDPVSSCTLGRERGGGCTVRSAYLIIIYFYF